MQRSTVDMHQTFVFGPSLIQNEIKCYNKNTVKSSSCIFATIVDIWLFIQYYYAATGEAVHMDKNTVQ